MTTFPAADGGEFRRTGTFSSMYFNEEAGDVLGVELKVVYTNKGFRAVCQIGSGEPLVPEVLEAKVEGDRITLFFNEKDGTASTFEGRYTAFGIEPVDPTASRWWRLKRQPSYWDEPRDRPTTRP